MVVKATNIVNDLFKNPDELEYYVSLPPPFRDRTEVNDAAITALIRPLTEWVINILIT